MFVRIKKYLIPLVMLLKLVSCGSNQEYRDLISKFPEVDYTNMNSVYCDQKTELQSGDNIIVYGGTNNFLRKHFGCDTCSAKVATIFFSKPTGRIAFLNFTGNRNFSVDFSISLYFWDNERGYNVSTLELWERKLTDEEFEVLKFDFITAVDRYRIDNNIYFKLSK